MEKLYLHALEMNHLMSIMKKKKHTKNKLFKNSSFLFYFWVSSKVK